MVDHIHFQYNGIMYGILLISISYLMKVIISNVYNFVQTEFCYYLQGKLLLSALWFTILLNMKHIYIYLAPAYFIYLLKHYCLQGSSFKNVLSPNFFKNITILGTVVVGVFTVTFAPLYEDIPQVSNLENTSKHL